MHVLTIAIPTWNNAKHLERTLEKVYDAVVTIRRCDEISIYISDNGSHDSTFEVINKYGNKFRKLSIDFSSYRSQKNKGFDVNVLRCFTSAKSKYVWFLSDDDEIFSDSIDKILSDIQRYEPGIIYYDFLQPPDTTKEFPYIEKNMFYKKNRGVVDALRLIVARPKLTSIVLSREYFQVADLKEMLNYTSSMFMHLALVFNVFSYKGSCLYSNYFIASSREDHFEQINFTASIANHLYDLISNMAVYSQYNFSPKEFGLKRVDELSISMIELGALLRGSTAYSNIRAEILKDKISQGFRRRSFLKNKKVFLIATLKLGFSLIIYLVKSFIGKGAKVAEFDKEMVYSAVKESRRSEKY